MVAINELAPQGAVQHLVDQAGREIFPKNWRRKVGLGLLVFALASCQYLPPQIFGGEASKGNEPPPTPAPTSTFTPLPFPSPTATSPFAEGSGGNINVLLEKKNKFEEILNQGEVYKVLPIGKVINGEPDENLQRIINELKILYGRRASTSMLLKLPTDPDKEKGVDYKYSPYYIDPMRATYPNEPYYAVLVQMDRGEGGEGEVYFIQIPHTVIITDSGGNVVKGISRFNEKRNRVEYVYEVGGEERVIGEFSPDHYIESDGTQPVVLPKDPNSTVLLPFEEAVGGGGFVGSERLFSVSQDGYLLINTSDGIVIVPLPDGVDSKAVEVKEVEGGFTILIEGEKAGSVRHREEGEEVFYSTNWLTQLQETPGVREETPTPDSQQPQPTPTEEAQEPSGTVEPIQIFPENQEIKGIKETVSLKELEQQSYWLFYYDPQSGIYKRLAYTSRRYDIDNEGYWHYSLVNNPENEKVAVIKRDDGSIIGIETKNGPVEAVLIRDVVEFFGGEDNVSDPIRVSDSKWNYNEAGIRKLGRERIDVPGYIPKLSQLEEIKIPDTSYTLQLVRVLLPRFYPKREDDGKIRIEQELWPYWLYYNVKKEGELIRADKVGICRNSGCTTEPSLKVFNEVATNERLMEIGVNLFTKDALNNIQLKYKGDRYKDIVTSAVKAVENGIISVGDEEILAKRALAAEEIWNIAEAVKEDYITYFAKLHLDPEASISTSRNRGDGVWVEINFDLPLPLPKPNTVIGSLGQINYPRR